MFSFNLRIYLQNDANVIEHEYPAYYNTFANNFAHNKNENLPLPLGLERVGSHIRLPASQPAFITCWSDGCGNDAMVNGKRKKSTTKTV